MTNFDLQDCKTGSYSNDIFAKLNRALTIADINKMFCWEDLAKIQEVYMKMVARHIEYVIGKLPYNAHIHFAATKVESDVIRLTYVDDHLTIGIKITMYYPMRFTCDCDNIIDVHTDKDHRICIADIQNTQAEIVKACYKVFEALTIKEDK